ncbi:MAG: thymidine kinase [Spirochaetales bacterium]|nr:thymidine kinase [Spirochaetales bacterium]
MKNIYSDPSTDIFLKSLGFPKVQVHHAFNHFDFTRAGRRILVIGPMGSGKTEYSARVWRDASVAKDKSEIVRQRTRTGDADRREVFFVRSMLDARRFQDYPEDALAFRGGYERCGNRIARISDSFQLEELLDDNPGVGTWIIDEASFYDERLAYVINNASLTYGLTFIFPTLILNFRRDIFNPTARFLLEQATDVFPLTAYCEHSDCIIDSFYTYRYYSIDGEECPALYFDPLIIIGGDDRKDDPLQPNYCTRCDDHHYLPGKEYTFLYLKPMGECASVGDHQGLAQELWNIKNDMEGSILYHHISAKYRDNPVYLNALKVPRIAEKALIYLFAEQNLVSEQQVMQITESLKLDRKYIMSTLQDNRRPINLDQYELPL